MRPKIAFIGMGEAGSALVTGWDQSWRNTITAYDIKSDRPETAEAMLAHCRKLGIRSFETAAEAVAGAELVFSAVTADQAVSAARTVADRLEPNAFWCDLNSCAPSSKRQAAEIVEAVGGRYVDVAVMAPVSPRLNLTPLLISGPHAEAVEPILNDLPMALRVVAGDVGAASSIKMIRSVMVKGLEALSAECMLAAVAAGVEEEVLSSLMKSHPGTDWPARVAYNFERAMIHGERRAAEMEEVAKTLADLALPADMARATIDWQRRIAATQTKPPEHTEAVQPKVLADLLLPKLRY